MAQSNQCITCKHYLGVTTCFAFLDTPIPAKILSGEFDHRKPHEGDNGIQWEANPLAADMIEVMDGGFEGEDGG